MPKAKLQATTIGGSADDVEAAFYEALQHGDIDALMACWADEDEVVCVHPGGARVVGARAVRASFEQIFAQGHIQARPDRVHKVVSLVGAMHSVVERVEVLTSEGPVEACAVATNVYHKTVHGWRMVAHHASAGSVADLHEIAGMSPLLH